jgi:hypothetical protein
MTSYWKIGAISGLIAGIIAGIVTVVSLIVVGSFELPHYDYYPISLHYPALVTNEIILSVIWGVILGLLYVCTYDLIPGEKIAKGIVFGMIYYLIYNIRIGTLGLFYGNFGAAISDFTVGFFTYIVFGVVLGILGKELLERRLASSERRKTERHDLKTGIYPGAFAGIAMGISVFVIMATIFNPELYQRYAADFGFLIGQLGTHVFFNMIFVIVFGILYVMFYDKIPGKGVLKGIVFSLVIFLITSFRLGIYYLAYGLITNFYLWSIAGFIYFPIFGLVLGLLYRKPSE